MIEALKREGIALFFAAGLAFAMFQGFHPFVDFCIWLQPIISTWREITRSFWEFLFAWLPFTYPEPAADFSTFIVFLVSIGVRILKAVQADAQSRIRFSQLLRVSTTRFHARSAYFVCGIVFTFILLPAFSDAALLKSTDPATSADSGLLIFDHVGRSILAVGLLVFMSLDILRIGILTEKRTGLLLRVHLSKHMLRVVCTIAFLLVVNAIGLYSDALSGLVPE
jgi:hypothetical protein